jgi:pimeloyl-ACP methyl ester carboxylesterase
MAYLRRGDLYQHYRVAGSGPPLLLIGGLMQPAWSWFLQVRDFRKRFRVVTFDNRGAGITVCPQRPFTMREMVEDAVALLDHLGIRRCHVAGLSMGGMIAQNLALDHPERVERLVLWSTAPRIEPPRSREGTRRLARSSLGHRLRPFGQMAAIAEHDTRARLGEIRAPTLVLVGESDALTPPRAAEALARGIPGARLVKIPEATHLLFWEKWREANGAVLEFLLDA